jgi:hypothetical protein
MPRTGMTLAGGREREIDLVRNNAPVPNIVDACCFDNDVGVVVHDGPIVVSHSTAGTRSASLSSEAPGDHGRRPRRSRR